MAPSGRPTRAGNTLRAPVRFPDRHAINRDTEPFQQLQHFLSFGLFEKGILLASDHHPPGEL